jgi:hypothetical protein
MIDEKRLVVQLAIGMVFLFSTLGKLSDPVGFARGVGEYRIVPKSLEFFAAMLVIVTETFLSISHLTGWLLRIAVPVGLVMLLTFSTAVIINLRRGQAVPCYCFGASDQELISGRTLARLLMLLAGEIVLIADANLFRANKIIHFDGIDSFAHFGLALFWAAFLLVIGGWLLNSGDAVEILRTGTQLNRNR